MNPCNLLEVPKNTGHCNVSITAVCNDGIERTMTILAWAKSEHTKETAKTIRGRHRIETRYRKAEREPKDMREIIGIDPYIPRKPLIHQKAFVFPDESYIEIFEEFNFNPRNTEAIQQLISEVNDEHYPL